MQGSPPAAGAAPRDENVAADAVPALALRGGLALLARQGLAHLLTLAGAIALARLLPPAEFGVVAIALFLQGALVSVASLGLGASLVQLRAAPEAADERAVLGAQAALGALLAIAAWTLAPRASAWLAIEADASALFRAVALAVLVAPLQTVPIARLERGLRFARVALVEVAQALAYNVTAVALVWAGWGLAGVGVALVVRAVAGATLAHATSPWTIGVAWEPARLTSLARFGVPLQAAVWLSLVKDSITPLLIAATAGATAVGYVSWAQTVSTWPALALIVLQRVYVPAFARLQERPRELAALAAGAVAVANAVAAPIAVLLLVLLDPMIDLVFGAAWQPAKGVFLLLWCANLIVPTVTPLVGLLNGVGRSRTVLGFSVLWAAATWLLGTPLVLWLGAIGYGVANLAVQTSGFWLIAVARGVVELRLGPLVLPSWIAAAGVGGAVAIAIAARPLASIVEMVALALLALLAYALALAAMRPAAVQRAWAALRAGAAAGAAEGPR